MDGAQKTRAEPRVIRVPPPEGEVISRRVLSAVAVAVGVAALIVAVSLAAAGVIGGVPAMIIVLGALSIAAFLIWLPRSVNASYSRKRAEFLATLNEAEADPLAAAIGARWSRPSKVLKPDEIRAVLRGSDESNAERAYVVCLGQLDVPEIDDIFFEPEIITPTRALGYHLWFVPPAVAVLTFWFLQLMGVIPGRVINIGSFGYILAMGVSAGALWVWRSAIRPTYTRMAPGVIQILEYHHRRSKPTIRSYALDGGTLALVRGPTTNRKPGHITLTLLRDERKDTLELWRMRKRDAIVERTWQALLSTAPTPPLSDEDLLG